MNLKLKEDKDAETKWKRLEENLLGKKTGRWNIEIKETKIR